MINRAGSVEFDTLCMPNVHPDLHIVHSGRDVGNMSFKFGSEEEVVAARERLFGSLGLATSQVAVLNPEGGAEYTDIAGTACFEDTIAGDGVIAASDQVGLMLNTADCIPLALFQPDNEAMSLMHLGWKGIVGNLHSKMIDRMIYTYGFNPENAVVYMGPSIHSKSYVVPEVGEAQRNNPRWEPFVNATQFGVQLDFIGFVQQDLIDNYGVSPDKIHVSPVDTGADDTHFSFVRHKNTGVANGRNGFVMARSKH